MTDARLAVEDALRWPELEADASAHRGPLVTMVVVTKDGLHHLRRLFRGLNSNTAYRPFEVIVVDNASTDGTREWLRGQHGFDVTVIQNDHNASFSEANNQALPAARGELVLILNNDIEPMHADWLSRLVAAVTDDAGVVAASPLLVYPERTAPATGTFHYPDLTVQHGGVGFEIQSGRVRARNLHAGADPRLTGLRATREVGALSAACLLTRTSVLRDLDGFDEAYFYGSEDWDLSLRLRRQGRLVVVGRSVLYHYEYGTQNEFESEERAGYRRRNHVEFNGVWGPALRRTILLEHLGADGKMTGGTVPTFELKSADSPILARIGQALQAAGWKSSEDSGRQPILGFVDAGRKSEDLSANVRVAVLPPDAPVDIPLDVDLVLGVDGRRPIHVCLPTAAAALDETSSSRTSLDSVVSGSRASAVVGPIRELVSRPRFAIRNCAPDPQTATKWGDTHFASSFAAALSRAGFQAEVHTRGAWDQAHAHTYDVVIHLRGLARYQPRPGAYNVMWLISHPDDVTAEELDDFDLVLVASSAYARKIRDRTGARVEVLHQATDVTRFHPMGHLPSETAQGIVVAANARWPCRRGPRWLMELGWDFSLYGANWHGFPEYRHVVAEYISNDELSNVYAAADIVVADQWSYMAREGFVANRLFDVAASGGFVISDGGEGIHELFGDTVPTYHTRAELDALLRYFLNNPGERQRRSHAAMALVRAEHTFDVRARQLVELIDTGPSNPLAGSGGLTTSVASAPPGVGRLR